MTHPLRPSPAVPRYGRRGGGPWGVFVRILVRCPLPAPSPLVQSSYPLAGWPRYLPDFPSGGGRHLINLTIHGRGPAQGRWWFTDGRLSTHGPIAARSPPNISTAASAAGSGLPGAAQRRVLPVSRIETR